MNDVSLSIQADAFTFETLLRSIYSEPDIACIRELIRNGIDSHISSGIDRKVDVSLEDGFFYLRDYGEGITPEKLNSLMSVVMQSSKRDESNGETGEYGLGSKTIFGILYNDLNREKSPSHIVMVSIADGVKSVYVPIIEDGYPKYQLISRDTTEEESGIMYMIERRYDSLNPTTLQKMIIFSPIVEHINFIGHDHSNDFITIPSGNFKVIVPTVDKNNVGMRRRILQKSNAKHYVSYMDMLYPTPIYNTAEDLDVDSIIDYANRYIDKYHGDEKEYLNGIEYLIVHDIGRESYGLEPTKSRDSLISGNMEYVNYYKFIERSIQKQTTQYYNVALFHSLIIKLQEYIEIHSENGNSEYIRNIEGSANNVGTAVAVITTIVISDEFKDFVGDTIPNMMLNVGVCPNEPSFTYDEAVYTLLYQCRGGIIFRTMISEETRLSRTLVEVYHTILHNSNSGITGVLENDGEIINHYTPTLSNYSTMGEMELCEGRKSVTTRLLEIDALYRYTGDESSRDLPRCTVDILDSATYDDTILLFKNGRTPKRKLEEYVKQNSGKTIIIMDRDGNERNNSRIIEDVTTMPLTSTLKLNIFIMRHIEKNGIKTLTETLKDVKVERKKVSTIDKKIAVGNMKSVARSVTIVGKGVQDDRVTYNMIVDHCESHDKIYVIDERSCTKRKSYQQGDYEIIYNVYPNRNAINTHYTVYPRMDNVHDKIYGSTCFIYNDMVRSEYDDVGFIVIGMNPTKSIRDYLHSLPHAVNADELMDERIKTIEEEKFGSSLDKIDIDSILNQNSTFYMEKRLSSEWSQCKNKVNSFYKNSYLSKYLVNKHIDSNVELVDIPTKFITMLPFMFDESELRDILNRMTEMREAIDCLIESYSREEMEFMICVHATSHGLMEHEAIAQIERMEKIYQL